MRKPELRTTAIISLALHITFFLVAVIIIKQTNHFIRPASYIVNLVGPEVESASAPAAIPKTSSDSASINGSKNVDSKEDEKQYASDRIAALKGKKKAAETVKLRNIISLKASGNSETVTSSNTQDTTGSGISMGSYEKKIGEEIRQNWAFPSKSDMTLEAIITVTIKKDGAVKINRIEKSSGDVLFDKSVLRAITKASPVTPPPYDMEEIGLRFTP
ncbi:MAG: TonB C-terminal domain-containing protein [Nitrospiraceae bacterium]|nr:TonB C-terminal domain-containing protein [Nitrospiraceae bacterium]